jgi:hypothetical protein
VPQAAQEPPLASVLPPQHAPEAQPRAQVMVAKALPSGMQVFRLLPSQVGPWAGLQVLQAPRAELQPVAQVSSE